MDIGVVKSLELTIDEFIEVVQEGCVVTKNKSVLYGEQLSR